MGYAIDVTFFINQDESEFKHMYVIVLISGGFGLSVGLMY